MSITTDTGFSTDLVAGTWAIDPTHTEVGFVARHLMVSKVRGSFTDVSGTVQVAENVSDSVANVVIKTASVSTGTADRDAHLKSADFFDVAKHPTARFVSRSVAMRGTGGAVTGDLTIKGTTRPLTLNATFVGAGVNPRGGKANFGFRATGAIKRSDFGLGLAAPAVSDRVDLQVNAAFEAA